MSELDVIRAVLAPIRLSLADKDGGGAARSGGPVFTQRKGPGGLDAKNPAPPYYLITPGPAPGAAGGPFDTARRFFVEGWGTWQQMADTFARLGWLNGHEVAREGNAARIRYGLLAEPARDVEPEATLPDGRELSHFSNSYQALYVDLSRLAGPAVANAVANAVASPSQAPPQARAP